MKYNKKVAVLCTTRRVEILVDRREPALDIIRVFATIVVLNFHYAALLGAEHSFFYKFANGDWGAGGVTIFLYYLVFC